MRSVTVSLPGAPSQIAIVPAGAEAYVSFPAGNIGGPVTVSSTQPVLASQRVQYYSSFNEVWAESASQATASSHFNWFDKASPGMFNDNIHLFNPGTASATVSVTLPGASIADGDRGARRRDFRHLPSGHDRRASDGELEPAGPGVTAGAVLLLFQRGSRRLR